jgi:hypothetical protein
MPHVGTVGDRGTTRRIVGVGGIIVNDHPCGAFTAFPEVIDSPDTYAHASCHGCAWPRSMHDGQPPEPGVIFEFDEELVGGGGTRPQSIGEQKERWGSTKHGDRSVKIVDTKGRL